MGLNHLHTRNCR